MRGFVIILCIAFAQAGTHNAAENRYRHRLNIASTTTTPASRTNRLRPELINKRSAYSATSIQSENIAQPIETLFNKEFYSYSAPEEDLKDIEAAQNLAEATRRNLRVIFIRAPENNVLTNAVLQLAQKNAESKTAIYVLTKQTDIAGLVNQLQTIPSSPESKPEVHFVKYRTPEDALRAQQIIQNEYDNLGGTSHLSNEGIVPVLDFYSKNGDSLSRNNVNSVNVGQMNKVAVMLNSYLPSKSRQ